jgi:hypothetical protein
MLDNTLGEACTFKRVADVVKGAVWLQKVSVKAGISSTARRSQATTFASLP